ncbi:MAG: ribbon-helix-helix protein, CopG family [Deltaproteobacteria bacterium]|nr:ribbon-helix-helix protein, CopG family [Deltaproteobacteria bacterium]
MHDVEGRALSAREIARGSGMSPTSVRRWLAQGRVDVVRVVVTLRLDEAAALDALAKRLQVSRAEALRRLLTRAPR